MMIELSDVYKTLDGRKILQGLNLSIREGETYVIIGRSGTGKSVTLKNIIGLMQPDRGEVKIMGQCISQMSKTESYEIRQKMGVLFQSGALINWLNVEDNVALPLTEHKRHLPKSEVVEIVRQKLELVELSHAGKRMPSELSGGMKKRAGLARAIVGGPKIILYDEPTSGLDPVMSNQINDLIISMQKKLGVTSICVTHDMSSAYRIANRIGMIFEGKIIEEGTPQEIKNTQNPIVKQFISGSTVGPLTQ
ncbi:ABC transporter ATP-binding protein [Candidatus Uabimicrobium sp. HlEnr_7]|uniref:ABC transporter ATP-binding protein n=1 Tax=Candidatus Uabimicrobium helgolandensis TaxID=3095367 RepID=UPI0035586F67